MKQSDVDLLKSLLIKKTKMKSENGALEINNTADGLKARILSLEGKTTQKTRAGYNKFNSSLIGSGTGNGVDFSISSGKLILNGNSNSSQYIYNDNSKIIANLAPGDYTFFVKMVGGIIDLKSGKLGFYLNENENETETQISNIVFGSSNTFIKNNFSITEEKQLYLKIYANAAEEFFENAEFELMILEGTYTTENAPVFEEYGVMPSLNFGSEVLGISGDISIKNKNDNFLDESKLVEKTQLGIISKIKNKKITYSGTCTGSGAVLVNSIPIELDIGEYYLNWFGVHKNPYFTLRKKDGTFLQNLVGSPTSNTKITIEEKNTYLIGLHGIAGQTYTSEDTSFNLMISKKNSVNYAEYKSKDYTISIDSKVLYGNEDVKDMIILKDGKWNWKNCWKKYILDGTEFNFIVKSDSILNNVFFSKTITNILAPKNNNGVIKIYSNYFANNTYVNKLVLEDIVGFGVAKDSRIQFGFGLNSEINSLELANAKLQELNASGHPLYVIYQLAEPEYEEITDETLISQLNKLLYQLKEYDDVTYINSDKEIEFEVLVEQDKLSILEKGGNENE